MFLWCAVLALVIGAVALKTASVEAAPGGKASFSAAMAIDDDCIIDGCDHDGHGGRVGDDCASDCHGPVGDDCAGHCSGPVGDDCAGDCPRGAGDDCAGDCGGHDKCP